MTGVVTAEIVIGHPQFRTFALSLPASSKTNKARVKQQRNCSRQRSTAIPLAKTIADREAKAKRKVVETASNAEVEAEEKPKQKRRKKVTAHERMIMEASSLIVDIGPRASRAVRRA